MISSRANWWPAALVGMGVLITLAPSGCGTRAPTKPEEKPNGPATAGPDSDPESKWCHFALVLEAGLGSTVLNLGVPSCVLV